MNFFIHSTPNTSSRGATTIRKASFICFKCLLLFLSLVFFVWGAFAYVPQEGPQAGKASFLQKVVVKLAPKTCPFEGRT